MPRAKKDTNPAPAQRARSLEDAAVDAIENSADTSATQQAAEARATNTRIADTLERISEQLDDVIRLLEQKDGS
jgi:hypothetical protein